MFDLILYAPVNTFSVMSEQVFLEWTSKASINFLETTNFEKNASKAHQGLHWQLMFDFREANHELVKYLSQPSLRILFNY